MWKYYVFHFSNIFKNSVHLKKLKLKIKDDVLRSWFMKESQPNSTLKTCMHSEKKSWPTPKDV